MQLTPTFPIDEKGNPAHTSSDPVMVERSHVLERDYADVEADSVDDAVRTVLEDYLAKLEHMTGEEGFITSS